MKSFVTSQQKSGGKNSYVQGAGGIPGQARPKLARDDRMKQMYEDCGMTPPPLDPNKGYTGPGSGSSYDVPVKKHARDD